MDFPVRQRAVHSDGDLVEFGQDAGKLKNPPRHAVKSGIPVSTVLLSWGHTSKVHRQHVTQHCSRAPEHTSSLCTFILYPGQFQANRYLDYDVCGLLSAAIRGRP